jgi:hypothetical protein
MKTHQHTLEQCGPDQAGLLKRKAAEPLKPKAAQVPCDVGLFSDSADQLDLVEQANRR